MGNKIVTEADRKRTPRPAAPKGVTFTRQGGGQRISQERGAHTHTRKIPESATARVNLWDRFVRLIRTDYRTKITKIKAVR